MTISGQAIFFDGKTSARHDVTVELTPEALRIRAPDGTVLAEWGYDELETLSAPDDELSVPVDRSGRSERRMRRRIIFWTVAAAASLILVAVFGLPAIATRLTPLVPYSLERKLGEAIDAQVRASLDTRGLGPAFECG